MSNSVKVENRFNFVNRNGFNFEGFSPEEVESVIKIMIECFNLNEIKRLAKGLWIENDGNYKAFLFLSPTGEVSKEISIIAAKYYLHNKISKKMMDRKWRNYRKGSSTFFGIHDKVLKYKIKSCKDFQEMIHEARRKGGIIVADFNIAIYYNVKEWFVQLVIDPEEISGENWVYDIQIISRDLKTIDIEYGLKIVERWLEKANLKFMKSAESKELAVYVNRFDSKYPRIGKDYVWKYLLDKFTNDCSFFARDVDTVLEDMKKGLCLVLV